MHMQVTPEQQTEILKKIMAQGTQADGSIDVMLIATWLAEQQAALANALPPDGQDGFWTKEGDVVRIHVAAVEFDLTKWFYVPRVFEMSAAFKASLAHAADGGEGDHEIRVGPCLDAIAKSLEIAEEAI